MNNIEKIYQQIIMEYNKRKDLKKELEHISNSKRGHNPSCGDDIYIMLDIEKENIKDASFIGESCAISGASTAMLIDSIKGKTVKDAKNILKQFFNMMSGENFDEDVLNDSILMEYVKDMPARIKCATLSWRTLEEIIKEIK